MEINLAIYFKVETFSVKTAHNFLFLIGRGLFLNRDEKDRHIRKAFFKFVDWFRVGRH